MDVELRIDTQMRTDGRRALSLAALDLLDIYQIVEVISFPDATSRI